MTTSNELHQIQSMSGVGRVGGGGVGSVVMVPSDVISHSGDRATNHHHTHQRTLSSNAKNLMGLFVCFFLFVIKQKYKTQNTKHKYKNIAQIQK